LKGKDSIAAVCKVIKEDNEEITEDIDGEEIVDGTTETPFDENTSEETGESTDNEEPTEE
jgi:hypothetical protein